MKNFLQDIRISIVNGIVALKEKSFRVLVYGTGTDEIPVQIITQASQLIAFGYLTTDKEYKKASAIFSQSPTVKDIAVYRKATATAWDTGLNTLINSFLDFWAITITSTTSGDQYLVESWAGANKKFFYGLSSSITIGDGRNQARASYFVHDQLSVSGYATISSDGTPFIGATVPALVAGDYDLNVKVDIENSLSFYEVTIAVLITDSWTVIVGKIQTALGALTTADPTVAIVNGVIKITSTTSGDNSKIEVEDGTAGNTPLLSYINNNIVNMKTIIDEPVNGYEVHPESAHLGRKLGREPQKQWKWKRLNGVPSVNFNITQLNTIRENKTNTMTEQAGQIVTNGGFTVDGGYIDITYSIDYIEDQLTLAVLGTLIKNESIAMTDDGIATIESVLRAQFDSFGKLGIIAGLNDASSDEDRAKSDSGIYMYKLTMPKRSEIPVNDRANRILSGVTFSYTVAGAMDEVEVDGTLEA